MTEFTVRIKRGWAAAGTIGTRLGADFESGGQLWTPVIWPGDHDPSLYKTSGLEFGKFALEVDVCDGGSVDVKADHEAKTVMLTFTIDERQRRARFPMGMVGNLCSVMLRECRVSTFRFSAKTGRHTISVPKDMDARDVAML